MHQLNWKKISWEDFELISLYLAQSKWPEYNFSTYLKRGHKQEGIDIYSAPNVDGRCITIQCKHIDTLTVPILQNIINEFLQHSFAEISDRFILAVTADSQQPKLQAAIRKVG